MKRKTAIFAVEDQTSFRALKPIANYIAPHFEVRILYLDSLFKNDNREISLRREKIPFEGDDFTNYVRFERFQTLPRSTPRRILQRLLLDNISHRITFKVDAYLNSVNPDVVVSAVDQVPFLRQLIVRAYHRDIKTVVLQHGTYERALDPELLKYKPFFPNATPEPSWFEYLKRRIGFKYGIGIYCNPYVDTLLTLGKFFTQRIKFLRSDYPDFGHTKIITTGSPEYDSNVQSYNPKMESAIFLSQQQYEGGEWGWETQEKLIDVLDQINDQIPITVRPHPKDSIDKIENFSQYFTVSRNNCLLEDVKRHDIIISINSTALFEGIIRGKVCGTIQLPCYRVTQAPFTHNHLIQFGSDLTNIEQAAEMRSEGTQRDYFDQFCYMPSIVDDGHESSLDLIVDKII